MLTFVEMTDIVLRTSDLNSLRSSFAFSTSRSNSRIFPIFIFLKKGLGGHPKTGQSWSLQGNRPMGTSQGQVIVLP